MTQATSSSSTLAVVPEWTRPLLRLPDRWLWALLLGYAGLWVLLVFGPTADSTLGRAMTSWGRYPFLLLAVALGFAAARACAGSGARRSAWAWTLLASAFSAIALGDIVWGWYRVVLRQDPTFSPSNVFYLSYFPLVLAGLLAWPRVFRSRTDAALFTLDALTVAVGAGMVLWYFALRPALGSLGEGPWLRTAMAFAYPIGDMLTVLGIALVLLRQRHGPERAVAGWLAASLSTSLVADCLWIFANVLGSGTTTAGSHLLWLFQTYFFLQAGRAELALLLDRAEGDPAPGWRDGFRWLPIVASVIGFTLLALVARSGDDGALDGVLLAAGLLMLLVIARNMLGQRETAQLLAENIQRRGESRFAALIEHASDAIVIVDGAGRVTYASPAAARLVVAGGDLVDFLHEADRAACADYLEACRLGHLRASRVQLRFGVGTDTWAVTETTLSNLLDDPKVAGIVLNVRDVSERRMLEEQLRFQALHDPLSGLPNRELFMDRIGRALLRSQQGEGTVGVAILNLDRYSQVNDVHGHRTGDQLLAAVAGRLAAALTGADSMARLGGDEFGVLFEDAGPGGTIVARVEQLRNALAAPFALDGHAPLRLSASIGYCLSTGVKGIEHLLRNADIALHEAKTAGGDRCEQFRLDRHGRTVERLALEAALPQLIENEAFTLQFQPIVRLPGRVPAGLYIQLDWRDRERAPVPIAEALAAARETGLGEQAGRWLLQTVRRDVAALMRYVPEVAGLALQVRLEAAMLRDPALPDEIARLLARLDLPARNLVFEIDEHTVAGRDAGLLRTLAELRGLGVGLALAGFGSATAGVELLGLLPFDQLVLAAPLVARLDADPQASAPIRATLAAAHALQMEVVASGVQDARQASLLAQLGCSRALGEYLGPSMRYERILTWLPRRYAELASGEE